MGILKKNNIKTTEKETSAKEEISLSPEKKIAQIHSSVLVRPIITEKSAILASQNSYIFCVKRTANKIDVVSAIKKMYGITPESVNIQNVRGKYVRRGKIYGQRKAWKKAIVTLPKGKSLNVYEGV